LILILIDGAPGINVALPEELVDIAFEHRLLLLESLDFS
jgi:hypothetical protein